MASMKLGDSRARTIATWAASAGIFAAVAIYRPWESLSSEPAKAAGKETKVLRTVTVELPSPATAGSLALPATIRPWQATTLQARVSGYLTAWHRDIGDRVKAGDVLAEIETPELDQEVAEAVALQNEAEAAAVQAQAERIEAEADLKVAEAQLVRVNAQVELAKTQLVRREKLLANRAVSQEEYDTVFRELEARSADVAAAEADIARRRANLQTRAAVIDARQATAQSRQSNVDRLHELQRFKRVVAPFDGIVTQRHAEVGLLVTAGKEPIFAIEDSSRVRVQVNVPQSYAAQASAGTLAVVSLPESSGKPVNASITRVTDSVDVASRTMLVEIELDNRQHRFQPGSYANVTLTTSQDASSWTIPTNTVHMSVKGPQIAAVNERDEIEIKPVTLGRDFGSRVVVAAGVRGDERLVVNPTDNLTEGLQVRVARAKSNPADAPSDLLGMVDR